MKSGYLLFFIIFTIHTGNLLNCLRKKKKKSLYCFATFQKPQGDIYLLSFFYNHKAVDKNNPTYQPTITQLSTETRSKQLPASFEYFSNHLRGHLKNIPEEINIHYSKRKKFYIWWDHQPMHIIKTKLKKI